MTVPLMATHQADHITTKEDYNKHNNSKHYFTAASILNMRTNGLTKKHWEKNCCWTNRDSLGKGTIKNKW